MRRTAAAGALLLACLSAGAVDWINQGARAMGMGGAGVAAVKDASAIYWNPAVMGLLKHSWNSQIDATAHVFSTEANLATEIPEILETINDLEAAIDDLEVIQQRLHDGTATEADVQAMLKVVLVAFINLKKFDVGLGVGADGNVNVQVRRFGFGWNYFAYAEGAAIADLFGLALASTGDAATNFRNAFFLGGAGPQNRYAEGSPEDGLAETLEGIMTSYGIAPSEAEVFAEELVYQAQQAGADVFDPTVQDMMTDLLTATCANNPEIIDNQTGVHFEGVLVNEITLSYGHPFMAGKLAVGANAKFLRGTAYQDSIRYGDVATFDDVVNHMLDPANMLDSNSFTLDMGLLYSPLSNLRFGITGRNLTAPEFRLPDGSDYRVNSTWRAGVAWWPVRSLCLAADIDLAANPTKILFDYRTREYSVGAEFGSSVIALRAGITGNLLALDDQLDYALGLGLGAGRFFQLDVAVLLDEVGDLSKIPQISMNDLQNSELPAGVSLAVSLRFNVEF